MTSRIRYAFASMVVLGAGIASIGLIGDTSGPVILLFGLFVMALGLLFGFLR